MDRSQADPAPASAGDFALLETMRLEGGTVARLDRHLARMAASAGRLGFAWDERRVRDAVDEVRAAHAAGCWRLRLLVDREGTPAIGRTPHEPGDARPWRVTFAASPIDAADPFLFHKTTNRAVYEAARQTSPDVDEVLLWNQRGEVTESTIASVVAEIDGERVTPPVACGLLPGTLRGELLEARVLRERVLSRDDVRRATRLWLINSLRGWIEAELVE